MPTARSPSRLKNCTKRRSAAAPPRCWSRRRRRASLIDGREAFQTVQRAEGFPHKPLPSAGLRYRGPFIRAGIHLAAVARDSGELGAPLRQEAADLLESGPRQQQQVRIADRAHRGPAQGLVEQSHLAEEIATAETEALLADGDLDRAAGDEVHAIGPLTSEEQTHESRH